MIPNGGWRMVEKSLETYGTRSTPPTSPRSSRRTARRTTTASSTCTPPERARGPLLAHHHRPAGRLRPRPDHRRLPPRRAVRRGRADRGQAPRAARDGHGAVGRGHHPRPRGERRADPGAPGAQADGGLLRLRHLQAGHDRPRGRAVAVLRLPGRGEGAERRGHVAGPGLHLPRRVPAARPRLRCDHRGVRAGADRRLRHQAAHRPVPADPPSTTPCSPATRPG